MKNLLALTLAMLLLTGCKAKPVPTSEEYHEAVVVGSGYGGAVAALRLAEANIQTLVLEKGRR